MSTTRAPQGQTERTVTITDADVDFVRLALSHYRLFASEVAKRPNQTPTDERAVGIFRAQEFYAERFLSRLEAP